MWNLFRGTAATSSISHVSNNTELQQPTWRDVKDSRVDGVSYEGHRGICDLYLQRMSPGATLDGLSRSGHHKLRINHDDGAMVEQLLERILENGLHEGSSWDFGFLYGDNPRPLIALNFSTIAAFMEACPEVARIDWEMSHKLPIQLLQSLEKHHPKCRIYYKLDFYAKSYDIPALEASISVNDDEHSSKDILRDAKRSKLRADTLIGSKLLYSITTEITYGGWEETSRMNLLHRFLIKTLSIRELTFSTYHSGCRVTDSPQPRALNFDLYPDKLPPLQTLSLRGYGFKDKPNGLRWMEWETTHPKSSILYFPWNRMPQFVIDHLGYPRIKDWGGLSATFVKREDSSLKEGDRTNLDVWLERMDWTKLQSLALFNPGAYELGKFSGGTLPGLRNVSFSYGAHSLVTTFLSNITANLEAISIKASCPCTQDDVVSAIITKHTTLKSLSLQHILQESSSWDRYGAYEPRKIQCSPSALLNASHLSQLRQACTQINSLAFNFRIGSEWNYEILDEISQFTTLENLTLLVEKLPTDYRSTREMEYGDDDEDWGYVSDMTIWKVEDTEKVGLGLAGYLKKTKQGASFTNLIINTEGREKNYA